MVIIEERSAERVTGAALRSVDEALEHVHAICFKTGPPRRVGVELEWTVHHLDDPNRTPSLADLRDCLADHAPRTVRPDSPHQALPAGGVLTVEPGGQVEISTPPHLSLATLHQSLATDLGHLAALLAQRRLALGRHGIDPYRPPRQVLHTPRYDAMAATFAPRGPDGLVMMCGTAATQVCLDAGQPSRVAARWAALHALGPVLVAAFATSTRHAGHRTGWASARMRAWLRTDPARTRPVGVADDPALAWAQYALAAPLLCLRRPGGAWQPPPGMTFGDWVRGAAGPALRPPTIDDLTYHLGTLFPPVRPRGYLEVRYLDAQPHHEWIAPVAVLAGLLADDATCDAARDLAGPVADRWLDAARYGLADPAVRAAAADVLDLGCRALDRTDLTPAVRDLVADIVSRRLAGGRERAR